MLVSDVGTKSMESVDYPDYAHKLAKTVKKNSKTSNIKSKN